MRRDISVLALAVILILVSMPSMGATLTLEKDRYALGERVDVMISGGAPKDASLTIHSTDTGEVYRFLEGVSGKITFLPRTAGTYEVNLLGMDGDVMAAESFSVGEVATQARQDNAVRLSTAISLDKSSVELGEGINITFILPLDDKTIIIRSDAGSYTLLGETVSPVIFYPRDSGYHEIHLKDAQGMDVANASFFVGSQASANENPAKQPNTRVSPALGDSLMVPSVIQYSDAGSDPRGPDDIDRLLSVYYGKKVIKIDKGSLRLIDSRKGDIAGRFRFLNKVSNDTYGEGDTVNEGVYDVEIEPQGTHIKKVSLFDLNFTGRIELGLDNVAARQKIRDRAVLRTFAIDPSRMRFSKGYVTAEAVGTELWKCREWDAASQACYGSWDKVMDIQPGQDYDIIIDPMDPGYAETGVAIVNSGKPIYHPGEEAHLIMVVLDQAGYPVTGADVDLVITSPDGGIAVMSTKDPTVFETSNGVYEADFWQTEDEGRYGLEVIAKGPGVDSNLTSYFTVQAQYDFDILRDTPSVINPYAGPFESRVRIVSHVDYGDQFSFIEFLPRGIDVLDAPGASVATGGDGSTELRYDGLVNGSVINYKASAELKSPEVYTLRSFVETSQGTFLEDRPWYIAIDPPPRNGIIVYRDQTDINNIKYRIWDASSSALGNEQLGPTVGSKPHWQKIRCMREHNLCLYVGNEETDETNFIVYNISSNTWGPITALGTHLEDWQAFDVECEDISGDCLIIYEGSTANDNIFYYRVFSATTLTLGAQQSFTVSQGDSNDYLWMELYPRMGSDMMGVVWQTDGDNIIGGLWDGSAFTSTTLFYATAPSIDRPTYDCAWEGSSGDFMCFYGRDLQNGLYAFRYAGGAWSDLGAVWPSTSMADESWVINACGEDPFSGNLAHDKLLVDVVTGTGARYGAYWGGTSLATSTAPTADTTTELVTDRTSSCAWEHDGVTAVVMWVDANSLTPEWGTFDSATNVYSFTSWASGSTTGIPTWSDDVESITISQHPTTDEMIFSGHDLPANVNRQSNAGCTRWLGSTFSSTGCGIFETLGGYDTTGNEEFRRFVYYDWFRFADIQKPGVTLLYPANDTVTANTYFNFTWRATDNKDKSLVCNLTVDGTVRAINVSTPTALAVNRTIAGLAAGDHSWLVTCQDDFDNYNASYTYTFTVAGTPVISVVSVGGDTTEVYSTTDQTPIVRASINLDSTCYLSEYDESYAQMVANGRVNCGSYSRKAAKDCEYTISLTPGLGDDNLYMACRSTFGQESSSANNKDMQVRILCDTHADCAAQRYCTASTQQCELDVLPGYSCLDVAYGLGEDIEVCRTGSGASSICTSDTSYSYTGWYCTADSDDCVYNNNGNSYDLNYALCASPGNDYRQCGASNTWGQLIDCGDLNEPFGQYARASTHAGQYCGYYSSPQTCANGDRDLGSFGCLGNAADCGSHIYLGGGSCGSLLSHCDVGCGAQCDIDNSTTPIIISDMCYYGRSCSNACAWQQSSEAAPLFCINDRDGGPCAYSTRTNPSSQDICYSGRECTDSYGANLTSSYVLRKDHCDYCDASGGHAGAYSPASNLSCSSGCADSGTIYYDTGSTPAVRDDDCDAGVTRVMPDTLSLGDIWSGSAPAYCDSTECDMDCGPLTGSCSLGVCICQDYDSPNVTLISPEDGIWSRVSPVVIYYNVSDAGSSVANCSLVVGGIPVETRSNPPESTLLNFTRAFLSGTYTWTVRCIDSSANHNSYSPPLRTLNVDLTRPVLSDARASGSSFGLNRKVCLNVTVTDTFSGVGSVLANIIRPEPSLPINLTLSDSAVTSCDTQNGNGVYSIEYTLLFAGDYTWTDAFAYDVAGNMESLAVGHAWSVNEGGVLVVSLDAPAANIRINESDGNNYYSHACTVRCTDQGTECNDIYIMAEYSLGAGFERINTTSLMLNSSEDSYFCGNLTQEGPDPIGPTQCSHTFVVSSDPQAGGNTLPVRCRVAGSNSGTKFSVSRQVSINDHPVAALSFPVGGAWLSSTERLLASASSDVDGTISSYLFRIDDNVLFTSPQIICSGSQDYCDLDTAAQSQCLDSVQDCYFGLTVTDNDGLKSSAYVIAGIDNSGPATTVAQPADGQAIAGDSYIIEMVATDGGSGVDIATAEYRGGPSDPWAVACRAESDPYACLWDLSSLPDGSAYEIRAHANDTAGNIGGYDTVSGIILDRSGPAVTLVSPPNGTVSRGMGMDLVYRAADANSGISSCSLYLDGILNQTNVSISESGENSFRISSLSEGSHEWLVNCSDTLGNSNVSIMYSLLIDNSGPITTITAPLDFADISGTSYVVSATAVDDGAGVDTVSFEFRQNGTAQWNYICSDDRVPYQCTWDITGLPDGSSYEVRASANDTLGNLGLYDLSTDISIDNNPPVIQLLSPSHGAVDGDGDVAFSFTVTDLVSDILNCSLWVNGRINQTLPPIVLQGEALSFEISGMKNGAYNWNVSCFDSFSVKNHQGWSENRLLTVDIRYDMSVSVTSDRPSYEVGNQDADTAEFTTEVTDYYGQPLSASVTSDIIMGTTGRTWWNTSWHMRMPIYLSESSGGERINDTIFTNITGLAGNISSCSKEIRIIDATTLSEVPVNVTGGDNSRYCEIIFLGSVSANAVDEQRYFAYFNNSKAAAKTYTWPHNLYASPIAFETFEVGSDFLYTAGQCPMDSTRECVDSSPWGDFDNCIETDGGSNYGLCSTTDVNTVGARGLEARAGLDRQTDNSDGLYKYINATPCFGRKCERIYLSYYQSAFSLDSAAEGSAVFAYDTDNIMRLISDCVDTEPCESGARTGMGTSGEYISQDLCAIPGIECANPVTVRFTSRSITSHTNADYFGWDHVNITGYTILAPGIEASAGQSQRWIERRSGTSGINGIWSFSWSALSQRFGSYSIVSYARKDKFYPAEGAASFTISQDSAPPYVELNSLPDDAESNSSVIFTYRVTDDLSSVQNCSLFIDSRWRDEDRTIQEGQVQFYYPRIPSAGPHHWNVSCSDYYLNTGTSETWKVTIIPPDLTLNSSHIMFNTSSPIEGENITINATIFNLGGSDAFNVTVQFYQGDPDFGGKQINGNLTIGNITSIDGGKYMVTMHITWRVPGPGPFDIYVVLDPPLATNGTYFELDETNNKAFNSVLVPSWHVFYGNTTGLIVLDSSDNNSQIRWNASRYANIYATETGSIIDWENLQALSRNLTNDYVADDFAEVDVALNMTGFPDSIASRYASGGVPVSLRNFTVYDFDIRHVPVANSTVASDFVTGILWDISDGGLEYNTSQDLVFVTRTNPSVQGSYGVYDYEMGIPVNLREYKNDAGSITLYMELI